MNFVFAALLFTSAVFVDLGSANPPCQMTGVQTGYVTTGTTGCGQSYPTGQIVTTGYTAVPVTSGYALYPVTSGYSGQSSSQAQAAALAQASQSSGGYGPSGGYGSSSQAQSAAMSSSSSTSTSSPAVVYMSGGQSGSRTTQWQSGSAWNTIMHGGAQTVPYRTPCYTGC